MWINLQLIAGQHKVRLYQGMLAIWYSWSDVLGWNLAKCSIWNQTILYIKTLWIITNTTVAIIFSFTERWFHCSSSLFTHLTWTAFKETTNKYLQTIRKKQDLSVYLSSICLFIYLSFIVYLYSIKLMEPISVVKKPQHLKVIINKMKFMALPNLYNNSKSSHFIRKRK